MTSPPYAVTAAACSARPASASPCRSCLRNAPHDHRHERTRRRDYRQRFIKALNQTLDDGDEISVSSIARRAGVDRSFLYRHRDLLEQIHASQARLPNTSGPNLTA